MLNGHRVCIDQRYRTEAIDLQPHGNTVSVETPSDNPFEMMDGPIEIVTQESGGMAGPDPRMRSKHRGKRVLRGPPPGKIPGRMTRAPAHRPLPHNAGFLPGLGDFEVLADDTAQTVVSPTSAGPASAGAAITEALRTGAGLYNQRLTTQQQQAIARQAQAQAAAEAARVESSRIASMFNATSQHRTLVATLAVIAGVALVGAVLLKKRKK